MFVCRGKFMTHNISLRQAASVWWRIALMSFGGPAGQIALMHRILVEEKRWVGEERFLHALNFCMLLPGPEAQQLATYIGWLLHKTRGGLIAGILFIIPGAAAIMALSVLYVTFGNAEPIAALFFGLKAAVLAIVFDAVRRIGARALRSWQSKMLAATAFVALFVFSVPFPIIVLAAGFIGWIAGKTGSLAFSGVGHGSSAGGLADADSALGEAVPDHAKNGGLRALKVPFFLTILWLTPLVLLFALFGADNRYTQIAAFFSQMAVLTFGGAYAVLAWVGQAAVEHFGWLSATEMLDGLGMAETTPGPLIIVTQHVGFLAGFRAPGGMFGLLGGILGGLLTTWVTFVPCFIWIFAGAPYIERLRNNVALSAALAAITAAIVGVILNLAFWFAQHFLFAKNLPAVTALFAFDVPVWGSFDWAAGLLSVAAMIALLRFKASPFAVIAGCAIIGIIVKLSGLA
jgi:chromate transporter